jgi:hypothetical protein
MPVLGPGGEATPAQPRRQGHMPRRRGSPAPARRDGGGLLPHQSSRGAVDTSIPSRSATASWLPTRWPSSPPGSSHPLPRLLAVVRSLPPPESQRSVAGIPPLLHVGAGIPPPPLAPAASVRSQARVGLSSPASGHRSQTSPEQIMQQCPTTYQAPSMLFKKK